MSNVHVMNNCICLIEIACMHVLQPYELAAHNFNPVTYYFHVHIPYV